MRRSTVRIRPAAPASRAELHSCSADIYRGKANKGPTRSVGAETPVVCRVERVPYFSASGWKSFKAPSKRGSKPPRTRPTIQSRVDRPQATSGFAYDDEDCACARMLL